MASRRKLSKQMADRFGEALATAGHRAHPILSAIQLVNTLDRASMNVSNWKLSEPGKPKGYFVGGEPDIHGKQLPELGAYKPGELTIDKALKLASTVREATGRRPGMHLGIWRSPDDGIQYVDASRAYPDRDYAIRLAQQRNEDAIWDNINSQEIKTGRKQRG